MKKTTIQVYEETKEEMYDIKEYVNILICLLNSTDGCIRDYCTDYNDLILNYALPALRERLEQRLKDKGINIPKGYTLDNLK